MAKEFYTWNEIVKELELPTWDEIAEFNWEYLADARNSAYREALKDEYPEEEAEEIGYKAEEEESNHLYKRYMNAVSSVFEELLDQHNLDIEEDKKKSGVKIVPGRGKTWKDAAENIMDTVNGVGLMTYGDLQEFYYVNSAKSWKDLVLSHLWWITYYPEVYGTSSIQRMFERAFD